MKPLQVWLPVFDTAVSRPSLRRDLRRAGQYWRGEHTIWLLPGLRGPIVWPISGPPWLQELAIPAETTNRVDVFHITHDGFIFGVRLLDRFADRTIDGYLLDWLSLFNGDDRNTVIQGTAPSEVDFLRPEFRDDGSVEFQRTKRSPDFLGSWHICSSEEARHSPFADGKGPCDVMSWPPVGAGLPPPVSPAEESIEYYGPSERIDVPGPGFTIPVVVSTRHPERKTLFIAEGWPGRLVDLLGLGGGPDAFMGCWRMQQVAEQSRSDAEAALVQAHRFAKDYLGNAQTTPLLEWQFPTLLYHGERRLLDEIAFRYNLGFASLKEACDSERFNELVQAPTVTRRALGILGLFWALLLEDLEEGRSFGRCQRCNRVIGGRKDRKYCGRDNPECFRARRAADRRRERQRKSRES